MAHHNCNKCNGAGALAVPVPADEWNPEGIEHDPCPECDGTGYAPHIAAAMTELEGLRAQAQHSARLTTEAKAVIETARDHFETLIEDPSLTPGVAASAPIVADDDQAAAIQETIEALEAWQQLEDPT